MFFSSIVTAALLLTGPDCQTVDIILAANPREHPPAEARCSCFLSQDPQEMFENWMSWAELVAEVHVVSVDTVGGPIPPSDREADARFEQSHPVVATLQVVRGWKGEEVESIELHMAYAVGPVSSCDWALTAGETYMLYGSYSENIGRYVAGYCSGTALVEAAKARGEFERLGPPKWTVPTGDDASIREYRPENP